MRSESEVRKALAVIRGQGNTVDDYRYGRHLGRTQALAWVLGELETGKLLVDEDFQSHQLEMLAAEDQAIIDAATVESSNN